MDYNHLVIVLYKTVLIFIIKIIIVKFLFPLKLSSVLGVPHSIYGVVKSEIPTSVKLATEAEFPKYESQ